jgi:hypothetical protein
LKLLIETSVPLHICCFDVYCVFLFSFVIISCIDSYPFQNLFEPCFEYAN